MADDKQNARIAPFDDEQIAEADRRIAQMEGVLIEAKELEELGILTPAQVSDMRKTVDTAKKIRAVMDRRYPAKK